MRFSRSALLDRLSGPGAADCVVLEAPTGYGKSWLARRVAADAVRVRADVVAADAAISAGSSAVVLDDVHELDDAAIDQLVDLVDRLQHTRLILVGRLVASRVLEAVELIDGLVLGTSSLAISTDEVHEVQPTLAKRTAEALVEAPQHGLHQRPPGGRLLLLEHVHLAWEPGRALQRWAAPAWATVAGGCRLDRDTVGAAQRAGFGLRRSQVHVGGWIAEAELVNL